MFTLEDSYGLTVSEADGEVCLKVDKSKGKEAYELLKMLHTWKNRRISYLPRKSAGKNTITGVITIHSSILHNAGRKFPQRNSAMLL